MTEKLTIVINGLEYVAKASTQSIELEQKDIKINELQRNLESLEDANVELQNVINQKLKLIKSLNERIDELEQDVDEKDSEYNELRTVLEDIQYSIERAL
jgi:chromosome segregation ATPase